MDVDKFLKEFENLQENLNNIWDEIGFSPKEKGEKREHVFMTIMVRWLYFYAMHY